MSDGDKLTKKDVLTIITTIKLNYSKAYCGYGEAEMRALTDFWFESLSRYPRSIVFAAVKKAVETSEFTPKLATVIKEAEAILNADAPTEAELWAELTGCLGEVYRISRYLPLPQYSQWTAAKLNEIYNSLSERLKLYVVNLSALIEISQMPKEELAYERARFFKQMPTLVSHAENKRQAQLLLEKIPQDKKYLSDKK